MPGPYIFKQIFAADPANTANVATNAPILLFAPGDPAMTPLVITDASTGLTLANPVQTNTNGFGPTFAHATLDQVAWEGGGFKGTFESWRGLKDDAEASATSAATSALAAEDAAAAAELAAANAAAGAETALAGAVGDAEAAKVAAQAAAGLVGAPAGAAVLAAIQPGGAAHGVLSAAIVAQISAALAAYIPKPAPIAAWAHWGDSMTAAGSSGNWVGKFAGITGLQHYNGGVGGESAAQIATRMTGAPGDGYRDRMVTLEAGRNGFKTSTPESIVDSIRSMVIHLTVTFRGFIFDVPPWSEEIYGHANRLKIDTLNELLESTFPSAYLPVYASLRTQEAATAAGITFTAQDNADIASGVTPLSFRTDGGHLNDKGGTAIYHFLVKEATARGYYTESAVTLHDAGVAGYVDRFYPAALDPTVGSVAAFLTDYAGGSPLTNTSGAANAVTVQEFAGIGKHLQATTVFNAGGRLEKPTDISGNFTFAAVVRTEARGADFVTVGGYGLRRAANGQWQLQGTGNILVNATDAWTLIIGVCAGASSILSVNGTETGPGTITGPNTVAYPLTSFGSIANVTASTPVEMAEFVVWDRVLDSTERAAVRTALKSQYPALI